METKSRVAPIQLILDNDIHVAKLEGFESTLGRKIYDLARDITSFVCFFMADAQIAKLKTNIMVHIEIEDGSGRFYAKKVATE